MIMMILNNFRILLAHVYLYGFPQGRSRVRHADRGRLDRVLCRFQFISSELHTVNHYLNQALECKVVPVLVIFLELIIVVLEITLVVFIHLNIFAWITIGILDND